MTFLRLAPAYPTIAACTSRRETSAEQRLDPFALLAQLGQGRVHALAAELVDGKTRHDAVLAAGEGDGVGVDDALGDAVAAIRRHGHADPVARGRAMKPTVHMVDRGGGGRGGRRGAARLEDRKSTRLNSSHSQISYAVFCLKKK